MSRNTSSDILDKGSRIRIVNIIYMHLCTLSHFNLYTYLGTPLQRLPLSLLDEDVKQTPLKSEKALTLKN